MLGRTHRFHGHSSLRRVYQAGLAARGPMMSLRYARRRPEQPYRVAVVVSRKVHKSAVTRNRIRRRVYEQVRLAEPAAGLDLVFTVFSEQLAELEAAKLAALVRDLLQKAASDPR